MVNWSTFPAEVSCNISLGNTGYRKKAVNGGVSTLMSTCEQLLITSDNKASVFIPVCLFHELGRLHVSGSRERSVGEFWRRE
ncbi:Hypothetical protein SMAX5B_010676 [Scophthalmus maximus]|uniref:Uncharacterized protein n=1 Tax=Scophthalmus maximus TaxID=52904 RepID=A0A2U9B6L6_SCOMX|nr:Hypothetical protein SMAX5B_010676 [Scophthalmus maximus]